MVAGSIDISSKRYVLTIQQKEDILFFETFRLAANSSMMYTVKAEKFNIVNGGVLSVNIFEINPLVVQYSTQPGVTIS